MADIELVIRIPEVTYNFLKSVADFEGLDDFERYIANGIPLPKGHGDLVDKKTIYYAYNHGGMYYTMIDALRNAPTIIKADKKKQTTKKVKTDTKESD